MLSKRQTTSIDVVVAATTAAAAMIQWSYFSYCRSFSLDKCNNDEGNSVSPSQMTAVAVLKLLPGLFLGEGSTQAGGDSHSEGSLF